MGWIDTDLTYALLKKMADVCILRQRVIANNIANVDTPGFKSQRVIFEEKLNAILKKTPKIKDVQDAAPEIRTEYAESLREDFNNVDIDKEMVRLAMNNLRYNICIQLLNKKLEKIKVAIRGR